MKIESLETIIKKLNSSCDGRDTNLKVEHKEIEVGYKHIQVKTELGDCFEIEWYINGIYIHFKGAIIICDEIKVSSTWFEDIAELDIQARYSGATIFILPIKRYERDTAIINYD